MLLRGQLPRPRARNRVRDRDRDQQDDDADEDVTVDVLSVVEEVSVDHLVHHDHDDRESDPGPPVGNDVSTHASSIDASLRRFKRRGVHDRSVRSRRIDTRSGP